MAAIRMVHPEHGATHAYDTGEVERLRGYGWKPEEQAPSKTVTAAAVEPVTVTVPEKKKPGRPKGK